MNVIKKIIGLKKQIEQKKQKEKLYQQDRDLDKKIFKIYRDIIKTTRDGCDKSVLFSKINELYKLKAEIADKILKIDIEIYDIAKNVLEKSI